MTAFMQAAMDRGDVRAGRPEVVACQFMALLTAETHDRLFQRNPPALSRAQMSAMVDRALETFLNGRGAR